MSDEWNIRYGRSLAMHEALVSAFSRVLTAENCDRWLDTVVSHTSSDRVRLIPMSLSDCIIQCFSHRVRCLCVQPG